MWLKLATFSFVLISHLYSIEAVARFLGAFSRLEVINTLLSLEGKTPFCAGSDRSNGDRRNRRRDFGADGEIRTLDPLITNQPLYH